MKNAWLITHDNHIDRRIFFFADVLIGLGYKVLLFASFINEELKSADPDYVRRPEKIDTIKNYNNTSYIDIEELEDAIIKDFLIKIISIQEEHYSSHGSYADDNCKLEKLGLRLKTSLEYHIIGGSNNWYSVGISEPKDGNWYVYNSITGKIRKTHIFHDNAFNLLERFVYHFKKELITDQPLENIEIPGAYNGNDGFNGIEYWLNRDNDNFIIKTKEIGQTVSYEYKSRNDNITSIKHLPFLPLEKDGLLGNLYDFIEFRRIIYDYSPIMLKIRQEIENSSQLPSVVYVADLPTLPIGFILKDRIKCKLIVDCHEWWKEQSVLWEPKNKLKINVIDKYEKMLYPLCDLRITVGELLADEMAKYYNCSFKTIYSCLTDKNIKSMVYDGRQEFWCRIFEIPKTSKIAVFQGSLTTLRNLDNLAKSSKYLENDNYIVIIGDGPYMKEFRNVVNREGNSQRVLYTGWVPQEELLKYTLNAHVGILPYVSLNNYYSLSLPNKFLEYYTANLPIICDNSLKEVSKIIIKNNIGISVDCSSPKELGEAINNILENDLFRDKIADNYSTAGNSILYAGQKEIFKKYIAEIGVFYAY